MVMFLFGKINISLEKDKMLETKNNRGRIIEVCTGFVGLKVRGKNATREARCEECNWFLSARMSSEKESSQRRATGQTRTGKTHWVQSTASQKVV